MSAGIPVRNAPGIINGSRSVLKPISKELSPAASRIITILLIVFPFIPFSISAAVHNYPITDSGLPETINLIGTALIIWGTLLAWSRGFPRWSYPYISIVIAQFLSLLASIDAGLSPIANSSGKLIVLTPIILFYVLVWLTSRQEYPFFKLVKNIQEDWTLGPYLVYGLLPLAIPAIYDDIHSIYVVPLLTITILLSIAGACLYTFLPEPRWRLFSLVASTTLMWAITAYASIAYWHGPLHGNGYQIARLYFVLWALIIGRMVLAPIITWIKTPLKSADLNLPG